MQAINYILQAFVSALKVILIVVLSFVLLRIPIFWNLVVPLCIVAHAVVMYAKNSMKTMPEKRSVTKSEAQRRSS